jgi:hypothetical protein
VRNWRTVQVLGGQTEMTLEKPKLKLFVVGQSSPDPSEWALRDYAIVVAANKDEARRLTVCPGPVAEIRLDRPRELVTIQSRSD